MQESQVLDGAEALPLPVEEITRLMVAAREDFLLYALLINPNFIVAPHHRLIADKLKDVRDGKIRRLMIFISPRSGKSLMSSILFPAWCLGYAPSWQVMAVSYSSELAKDFGREVRNIIDSEEYKAIFENVSLRADSRSAGRWHTAQGGTYTSAGIGGGIAGRGANLAIIDDPISEQDAWSKAAREHVIRWYPGGLRTRLMPGGRIVVIQTRWHDEDLSGYLLTEEERNDAADKWEVIKIPAILDEASVKLLQPAQELLIEQGLLSPKAPPIEVGGSYWPVLEENANADAELRGWYLDELQKAKENMPPYQWAALYMQDPVPEEGGIIKIDWWKKWPKGTPPKCDYVLQSYDTAFKAGEESDYSAVTTWGIFRDDNNVPNLILLGAKKGRWEFPELRKMAMEGYNKHNPDAVIIEDKASGQSLIQDLSLAGLPIIPWKVEKDKVARAHACTPLFHSGRVWIPDTHWADEVITECAAFPKGMYDDYVDSVTQAVLWMRNGTWVRHPDDEYDEDEPKDRRPRRYY